MGHSTFVLLRPSRIPDQSGPFIVALENVAENDYPALSEDMVEVIDDNFD